jgi:hypothetical protein
MAKSFIENKFCVLLSLLYGKIIVKGATFKAVRLHGTRERLFVFQIVIIFIHILWPASIFISAVGVVRALKFIYFILFFYWRVENSLSWSCELLFILDIARKL